MSHDQRASLAATVHVEDVKLPMVYPVVLFETTRTEPWDTLSGNLHAMGFPVLWSGDTRTPAGTGLAFVRVIEEGFVAADRLTPFIIVARGVSPNGVSDALRAGASGYFIAPIEVRSVATAICVAWQRACELEELQRRTSNLSESVQSDQTISAVVGILMERYHCQRTEAYERLRRYARNERRKVLEIATKILTASEEMNRILTAVEAALPGNSSVG